MSMWKAVALMAVAGLFAGCGEKAEDKETPAGAVAAPVKAETILQKTCPVMTGNAINPELFVEVKGRKIYVCCPGCLGTVKADPDKYIAKVDADIAAAKKTDGDAGHGKDDGHGH